MIDSRVLPVYYRVYSGGETWRSILPVSLHEGSDHEVLLKNSPFYPVGSAVEQKIIPGK